MTQQAQQQQQQQMIQPPVQPMMVQPAAGALAVDVSKVTASGSGLHQANINQESSFIVDGSQSGTHSDQTHAELKFKLGRSN